MIQGEQVTVRVRKKTGTDSMNNPVWEWVDESTVDDVLVSPGSTDDLGGSIRPDGTEIVLTLHFPKSFTGSLRNRRVLVRGRELAIVGDPVQYSDANTPTRWHMPAQCKEVDG
jgi:hypothetical protein